MSTSRPMNRTSHTIHRHDHHFGWDHSFQPKLTVAPGETVTIETVDSSGGQLGPGSTIEDLKVLDFGKVNPVTGPIRVDGAEPGDALKDRKSTRLNSSH